MASIPLSLIESKNKKLNRSYIAMYISSVIDKL